MQAIRSAFLLLCLLLLAAGCSMSPEPLTPEEFKHIAVNDRERIFDAQERVEGELTLEIAMALALKYNLENRVRLLEEAVANQQLDMTKLDLLPNLAANAGYLSRDNINASTSVSVLTGNVSLEPSTSQDQEQFNSAGLFTWNLLDFGVSYLQAKQDADRFLIAQKAREKVMLTLLKEVRGAYWTAVAMEQMRGDLDRISAQVDELLQYWESIREQQLRSPIAVLMDIRSLLETRQQLDELRRSMDTAQARLANLINAQNLNDIQLPRDIELPALSDVSDDIDGMELVALMNSADYASEVYKVRIDQLESRKAMVQLLPGLEFTYGANYDDNSFLFNNHWGQFGVNLTGDITQLFFTKQIRKFRETSEELTVSRKLAINMAVITGVHISWQDYRNSVVQFDRAVYVQEIDQEISNLTRNANVNQAETGAAAIQSELRAFRSKISQLQSYADAQEAFGALMVSLGVNPIPIDYQQRSVRELASEVAWNIDQLMLPYTKEGEQMLAEERWRIVNDPVPEVADEEVAEIAEAVISDAEAISKDAELALAEADRADKQTQPDRVAVESSRQNNTDASAGDSGNPGLAKTAGAMAALNAVSAPTADLTEGAITQAEAPDMNEFLADFWQKYFPTPDLKVYLKDFIDGLPEGPKRESYLRLFQETSGASR